MSKDAVIRVVDNDKTMTSLDKLRVRKTGGGYNYWVPESEVQTTTKHITKNGTYKAKDDGKYAYSEVTVNVSGGNGSADSQGKPTGTIPPGDIGSAVIGEDEDGNDAVIGVDENGKLVKTPLPSSIVLVTPPTKMDYNDGETIDLSGAVVVAKMADGTTWTDADHPNGHVSCSCDPTTADASQAGSGATEVTTYTVGGATANSPIYVGSGTEHIYQVNDSGEYINIIIRTGSVEGWGFVCIDSLNESVRPVFLVSSDFSGYLAVEGDFKTHSGMIKESVVYNGQTVYYAKSGALSLSVFTPPFEPSPYANGIDTGKYAWLMKYGERRSGGTQTITLNWARPGDGKVLSTTMQITVTGSSSTSESSSGTEGSGGGGGF